MLASCKAAHGFNKIDPHLKDLILSQAIKRLEEQIRHRGSLLELVLDGRWGENVRWADALQLLIDLGRTDRLVELLDSLIRTCRIRSIVNLVQVIFWFSPQYCD